MISISAHSGGQAQVSNNDQIAVTVAAGVGIAALLLIAAARGRTALSSAVVTAVAYLIWTGGCVALLLGAPSLPFWAGLRPFLLVLISAALRSTPGPMRTGREWLELLLDGWMTVGGLFGLFWIVAKAQDLDPDRAPLSPVMLWLVGQILLMSMVGGMLARSAPGQRRAQLISFVGGLIVLAGDVLALVTGNTRDGIGFWLGGGLILAVSVLLFGGHLDASTYIAQEQPLRIRAWQLPIAFTLAYVFLPIDHDGVLDVTMGALVAVLFLQLVVHSRGNEGLWRRLLERTRIYQQMLLDSQDVILQVDARGVVEFANPATARVLSLDPDGLVGTLLGDYLHPDDPGLGLTAIASLHSGLNPAQIPALSPAPGAVADSSVSQVARFRVGAGWRYVEWTISPRDPGTRSRAAGWILSGRDVSDRIALQSDLVDAARTDMLTGLLNRGAFLVAVGARLAAGPAAVLFVDLDDFKSVNDTMGHGQGDEVLRRAAECLAQAVGPDDQVARLGGDEFAVLTGTADPVRARTVAEDIVTAFNGFDEAAHGRPSVSASVGVAVADHATAIELLRDADLAMYRAKKRGGAGLVEFESWMSDRVMESSRLRADLETAVREEKLALYLQPVVDLHTRQWEGFEALVRWPVGRETWSPAQFLPVAEESGLIVPMGAWVLGEALRQLAGWRDTTLGMAVNVSALQLVGTDFHEVTMAALAASGVSPDRLTLEITEQAAIQDLGRTASRLEALRSEGIHVAIDDFGTGFSSLQYLSRLPVDILKIDRKFVWGLGQQAEDDVLVRSMLGLAAELGLQVIAEGVETRRQADLLLEYGCRLAQGFLFSPPRPIEELRSSDPFVSPAPAPPHPRPAESDRARQSS